MQIKRWVVAVALAMALAAIAFAASVSATTTRATAGTVTVGSAQGITSLDPQKIALTWEQVLYPVLWCSLTRFTQTSGANIVPDVASSWTVAANLKTYTLKLNPRAQFANGTKIDAAAVAASMRRLLDPKTAWQFASTLSEVKDFVPVGSDVLRIDLRRPDAYLLKSLASAPIIDISSLSTINTTPNGCGPYEVKDFVPDDHVTLVPNPNYFLADKAKLDQLNIVKTADIASAVAALRSGSIDALFQVPATDLSSLKKAGFKVVTSKLGGTAYVLTPDNHSPPFNNPLAREALSMSLDRATINKAVFGGIAVPAPSVIPPSDPLYAKVQPDLSFNLKRAKRLFTEAGVTSKTKLIYWSTPINAAFDPIGAILAADLKKIGLNLTLKSIDVNTWVAKFYPGPHTFPGYIVIGGGRAVTPDNLLLWAPGACQCQTKNTAYTSAIQAGYAARTKAAQKAAFAKVQEIFAKDSPINVILFSSEPIAVSPKITGIWKDPGDAPRLEDAARLG